MLFTFILRLKLTKIFCSTSSNMKLFRLSSWWTRKLSANMYYFKLKLTYIFICYYFITVINAKDENWRGNSNNNNIAQRTNSSESLSRKKRFIFPAVATWRFDLALTLIGYAEGYPDTTSLVGFIPFTWNLNTLRWAILYTLDYTLVNERVILHNN